MFLRIIFSQLFIAKHSKIGAGFQIHAYILAIRVTMIFIFKARIGIIENVFSLAVTYLTEFNGLVERSPGNDSYD